MRVALVAVAGTPATLAFLGSTPKPSLGSFVDERSASAPVPVAPAARSTPTTIAAATIGLRGEGRVGRGGAGTKGPTISRAPSDGVDTYLEFAISEVSAWRGSSGAGRSAAAAEAIPLPAPVDIALPAAVGAEGRWIIPPVSEISVAATVSAVVAPGGWTWGGAYTSSEAAAASTAVVTGKGTARTAGGVCESLGSARGFAEDVSGVVWVEGDGVIGPGLCGGAATVGVGVLGGTVDE